ncbi:hypothetical protein MLD38_011959 [Melastoma candidum]|uniref:Uncharacterized protein n=1 Tax=Melastoma candidum TaxID=119954 RepID=A0ACB9R4U3_9MYRT|nr:hypothetical protein MLD38_011959 [Melastoma candidum]
MSAATSAGKGLSAVKKLVDVLLCLLDRSSTVDGASHEGAISRRGQRQFHEARPVILGDLQVFKGSAIFRGREGAWWQLARKRKVKKPKLVVVKPVQGDSRLRAEGQVVHVVVRVLPVEMPPNVKGFLKGLKYIQNIFENPKEEEEEEELQIGLPTDVKHVAHIGSDGPSSNAPSWMTEFNSSQLTSPPALPAGEDDDGGNTPTRDLQLKKKKEKETSPRSPLSAGNGPPLGSPPKKSTKKHHLRRNRAPTVAPCDSGTPESPKAPGKHGRGKKKSTDASSSEPSAASKPSRRKRSSKSSLGGGSSTSSRPKSEDSFDEVVTADLGLSSELGRGPDNSTVELRQMKDGSKEGNRWGKIQGKTKLLLKSETKATISR